MSPHGRRDGGTDSFPQNLQQGRLSGLSSQCTGIFDKKFDGYSYSDNSSFYAREPNDVLRTKIIKCMLVREVTWCSVFIPLVWLVIWCAGQPDKSIHPEHPQKHLTLYEPDRGHATSLVLFWGVTVVPHIHADCADHSERL